MRTLSLLSPLGLLLGLLVLVGGAVPAVRAESGGATAASSPAPSDSSPAPFTAPLAPRPLPAGLRWREEPRLADLFRRAGRSGTFVILDARRGELVGTNRARALTRYTPASTFKIPNSLIGLSVGAVTSVDTVLPYRSNAPPFSPAWEKDMGLREAMVVSNVPTFQELARRIGLARMGEAVNRLDYGNRQIGSVVDTFWLRGPLAISAVEQTRFLDRLARQLLPFPLQAQRAVRENTLAASIARRRWSLKPGNPSASHPFQRALTNLSAASRKQGPCGVRPARSGQRQPIRVQEQEVNALQA